MEGSGGPILPHREFGVRDGLTGEADGRVPAAAVGAGRVREGGGKTGRG